MTSLRTALLSAVLFAAMLGRTEDLYTETYAVPPDFFEQVEALPDLPEPSERHREILERAGIRFPEGATVTYNPLTSRLIVRNTKSQMDLVGELVTAVTQRETRQVYVTIKEVTLSEKIADTSGFDWILGPSQNPVRPVPVANATVDSRESFFDKLRKPPEEARGEIVQPDPDLMGIAGVFTDPQFQVVIRALNQQKGVDLLSAPSVVCRSGQAGLV